MKQQFKLIILIAVLVLVVSFAIPILLVLPFSGEKASGKLDENLKNTASTLKSSVEVAVYRNSSKKVEKFPLEEYVIGVVASEMPAKFEEEALKAQALAARTYIVNHLLIKSDLPKGANVTDTVNDQVFKSKQELKKIWAKDYNWKINKITQAVKSTEGKILTYQGKPIFAAFFSTSNGYTENAEEYWSKAIPYLKSVESPWDKNSPEYVSKKTLTVNDFENMLGVKLNGTNDIGTITTLTKGKKVGTIVIAGKKFSGREVREKLNLRSSDFSFVRVDDKIIITTKGYGHGVGMSQYGANEMAKSGENYLNIVKHYYKGVKVESSNQLLDKVTAKR
ncbi:stage II sporulation protein D [Heyndrickxia sp. NPDC080065]|uniref:stage II sporulation protein D n=1 Tax=Heyndrickxia sp. NPDC080065 TaxID=3390568 RepID=UPI003D05C6C8